MWVMLYAQAGLMDGSDQANVLVFRQQMFGPRGVFLLPAENQVPPPTSFASTALEVKQIAASLADLGFSNDASLSVLAVELLPPVVGQRLDPLGVNLGSQRILRTSALTPVPVIC
jgi:hypothetical protein